MTHAMALCQGKHKSRGLGRALGIVPCSNPHGPGEDTGWVPSLNSAGAGENLLPFPALVPRSSAPHPVQSQQNNPCKDATGKINLVPEGHPSPTVTQTPSRIWESPSSTLLLLPGKMQPCPADSQRSLFLRKMSKS